ncbi:PREDICTED: NAC domain-containing protein 37 [Theobroma cacao]|uniref:NAC domain-containing protein 37 n=1 Tax=Theobroma cacao TaxID=3641 RepID=A0AB32V5B2_THECC|nr:PREDICTED: NAC domain-containing protein 37 [Theobroma cacao]
MLSPGYVFDPTDREIVSYYLPRLIAGRGNTAFLGNLSYFFNVRDVYSRKPSLLFETSNNGETKPLPFMKGNQRFFFSSRRQRVAETNSDWKSYRRTVQEEGQGEPQGCWKRNSVTQPIFDDQNEEKKILGCVNLLGFFEYRIGENNKKEDIKSNWIMYEYYLLADRFQDWVICKIKDKNRSEEDEFDARLLHRLFSPKETVVADGSQTETQPVPSQSSNLVQARRDFDLNELPRDSPSP